MPIIDMDEQDSRSRHSDNIPPDSGAPQKQSVYNKSSGSKEKVHGEAESKGLPDKSVVLSDTSNDFGTLVRGFKLELPEIKLLDQKDPETQRFFTTDEKISESSQESPNVMDEPNEDFSSSSFGYDSDENQNRFTEKFGPM